MLPIIIHVICYKMTLEVLLSSAERQRFTFLLLARSARNERVGLYDISVRSRRAYEVWIIEYRIDDRPTPGPIHTFWNISNGHISATRPFWGKKSNSHTSATHYPIHIMYVHTPYFALGRYRLLTHMTGDWTLILQGGGVTSRPKHKENEQRVRFGEIDEKILREE